MKKNNYDEVVRIVRASKTYSEAVINVLDYQDKIISENYDDRFTVSWDCEVESITISTYGVEETINFYAYNSKCEDYLINNSNLELSDVDIEYINNYGDKMKHYGHKYCVIMQSVNTGIIYTFTCGHFNRVVAKIKHHIKYEGADTLKIKTIRL